MPDNTARQICLESITLNEHDEVLYIDMSMCIMIDATDHYTARVGTLRSELLCEAH